MGTPTPYSRHSDPGVGEAPPEVARSRVPAVRALPGGGVLGGPLRPAPASRWQLRAGPNQEAERRLPARALLPAPPPSAPGPRRFLCSALSRGSLCAHARAPGPAWRAPIGPRQAALSRGETGGHPGGGRAGRARGIFNPRPRLELQGGAPRVLRAPRTPPAAPARPAEIPWRCGNCRELGPEWIGPDWGGPTRLGAPSLAPRESLHPQSQPHTLQRRL